MSDDAAAELFAQHGIANNVDPLMMQAIGQVESQNQNYHPDGTPVVSPTGAKGRMQFTGVGTPGGTGYRYGVTDPFDDAQSIPAASKLMDHNLNAANGDVGAALKMYNGGGDPNYANKVFAAWRGLQQQQQAPAAAPAPVGPTPVADSAPASTDAFWSGLGAKPDAAPAASGSPAASASAPATAPPADTNAFWNSLGTPDDGKGPPPTTMQNLGAGIQHGMQSVVDTANRGIAAVDRNVPILARLDALTGQTPQAAVDAQPAAEAAYQAKYGNSGWASAGNVAGQMINTAPLIFAGGAGLGALGGAAAEGVGGAATMAGRGIQAGTDLLTGTAAAPGAGPMGNALARTAGMATSGAATGAATNALTGQPVDQGAAFGGILGGGLGAAGGAVNALARSASPGVQMAVGQMGIPLRAGQVSSNSLVRYLDNMTAPESSNVAQREAVNTYGAKSMNLTPDMIAAQGLPAGKVTPAVMQAARDLNGGVMNTVESRTTIPQSPDLMNTLKGIAADAAKTPSAFKDLTPHFQDVLDAFAANNGTLPGKVYGNLVAHGSPLDVATNADNSTVRNYAGQIKSALQDAMQSAATPADAAAYSQARLGYKNMMTLAPIVNKGTPGDLSPLLLQGAANRSFKNNAFSGAGDLGDLGDVAQQYMRAPAQSGTEPRELIRNTLYGDVKGLAKMAAGQTAGRAVQSILGANPLTGPFVTGSADAIRPAIPGSLLLRNQLLPQQQQPLLTGR